MSLLKPFLVCCKTKAPLERTYCPWSDTVSGCSYRTALYRDLEIPRYISISSYWKLIFKERLESNAIEWSRRSCTFAYYYSVVCMSGVAIIQCFEICMHI